MKNKSVLVVGGAGFIGSSLVKRLHNDNKVHVADNFLTGSKNNLFGLKVEQGAAKMSEIDYIFYFGGKSSLPLFDNISDVCSDLNVFGYYLGLAERLGIPIIFASTSSFYSEFPSSESSAIHPKTYYECTKISMENMARTSYKERGAKTIGMRFFSVYGKRERSKKKFANLVTQMIWAQEKREPFEVYGDGAQTRDFTYIEDLIDAVMILAERGSHGEIYNIGYGVETSINEAANIIREVTGKPLEIEYVENPLKNYVKKTISDSSKIRKLGWKPKYDLIAGIKDIIGKK